MNKLISTKNRVFISLVGPSETAKSQFIYNWLKIGTFPPKFDKIYFFYQHSQPLYDVMQKEIENLEFVHTILVKRFAIQKPLLTLLRLGDIEVLAQSPLNTTFFTRANQEETLSYKTLTLFSSSLPVT